MPDNYETEPHSKRHRWVILALIWLLYAMFGLVAYSLAPLVTPILKDLNMSFSQMGLVLGSWQLTYIAIAVIAGTIIDRWGMRKSLFTGALIIGLSAILRYFPVGFSSLLPAVALFGVGGPLISIGAPKAISMWFEGKSRRTAVGIYMTGPRVAGFFAVAATNSVVMPLTGYSWRLTFVCYGALTLAAAVLWWLMSRKIEPTESTESASMKQVFSRLIKVRNVIAVLIIGTLAFTIGHGFNNWLPKILESGGLSPATAGLTASIPLLVNIPAVLLIPQMVPSHLRGRSIAVLTLLSAISLVMSVMASSATLTLPLLVGLVLFGITSIPILPLSLLVLMDTPEVGSRYMGAAGGMFFCIAEVGGFTGPLIMGALVDMTGGFLVGTSVLASLSLIIFAVTFLLKAPPASDREAL